VHVSPSPPMADLSPSDCERIIIVGAGGFGREVLQWARHAWPEHVSKIAGFLSADPEKLASRAPTLPILGDPARFEPQPGDGLFLAIGIRHVRRGVAEQLEARGARFLTLIHPTAIIADTAQIGTGTIICPYAIVSDAVRLGRFVLLNYHASVAHDSTAGDHTILSPYAALAGSATTGANAFLGIHAAVGPGVTIGAGSVIAAESGVLHDVPDDSLAFGVPARVTALVGR
jgi:sugar O-acyltransferase (sialic acid O-acetyltransferase NeuD family)